jgi:hypothetical protein
MPSRIAAGVANAACQPSPSSATRRIGEREEAAAEAHALVRPARAHDPDRLVGPRAALAVGRAEQLDLLAHPADARAEDHAARREVIERRQHLRREHRMAMRQHEHRRAELHALGGAGDHGQRGQRLEEVRGGRQRELAGLVVGIARLDVERHHHVVARPHGVEAHRLHAARERDQRLAGRARPPDR